MQRFLGLDLAWYGSGKTSAIAVLEGDCSRVELVGVFEALDSDDDILGAIEQSALPYTALAIDAPLVIANATGQRECETAIGRRFGHADASAHTSNLTVCRMRGALPSQVGLSPPAGGTMWTPQWIEGVTGAADLPGDFRTS